jgi:hypothetical protein
MSRLDSAPTHARFSTRRISAAALVALAIALSSPLGAAASATKGHAPNASWSDRHTPRASWSDAHAPRASWSDASRNHS